MKNPYAARKQAADDGTGVAPKRTVTVGRFHLDSTGSWTWSDEVFSLYGFAANLIKPTTELLIAHAHPEDRSRLLGALARAQADGGVLECTHQIRDAQNRLRTIEILGHGSRTSEGTLEFTGYFTDRTRSQQDVVDREVKRQLEEAVGGRRPIEQAKGVVRACLGLNDDEAFAVLRQCSNNRNIPLRQLAAQLIDELAEEGAPAVLDARAVRSMLAPRQAA